MEHSLFLRQYKYELPALPAPNPQPGFLAFFDFENGGFQLECDYRFIVSDNKRDQKALSSRATRIFIEAEMKAEIPSGPDDNLKNELLLFLKGTIYDGERKCRCTGLLQLNRNYKSNKEQWMIYCNLVDNDMDIFEIKLKLPVITNMTQVPHNN